ncbi:MAG: hypothetical protein ACTSYB_17510 [Candidatus Helarchaeota archaeon]
MGFDDSGEGCVITFCILLIGIFVAIFIFSGGVPPQIDESLLKTVGQTLITLGVIFAIFIGGYISYVIYERKQREKQFQQRDVTSHSPAPPTTDAQMTEAPPNSPTAQNSFTATQDTYPPETPIIPGPLSPPHYEQRPETCPNCGRQIGRFFTCNFCGQYACFNCARVHLCFNSYQLVPKAIWQKYGRYKSILKWISIGGAIFATGLIVSLFFYATFPQDYLAFYGFNIFIWLVVFPILNIFLREYWDNKAQEAALCYLKAIC